MAQFTPKKINKDSLNGGQELVSSSGVKPEFINSPINSALYTEKAIDVLTSNVDVSEIEGNGAPSVQFIERLDGTEVYRYLKFKNLRKKQKTIQAGTKRIESSGLPETSTADAGKILMVNSEGKPEFVKLTAAEGESF